MQQINQYIEENGLLVISRIICMGMLTGLSVSDLKYHKISGSMLMLGSVMAAGYTLLAGKEHIWLAAGGLLIGLIFVLVSRLTREQLGYGDSWLLCILGVYLGTWNLLMMLFVVWMAVAFTAAVILAVHRYGRKTAFPMVPFIAAGYMVMWAGEMIIWP